MAEWHRRLDLGKLLGSFPEGRRFSPWPRCKPRAACAPRAVSKMRGRPGRAWDGMHVIAVCFVRCSRSVLDVHTYIFSIHLRRLGRLAKLAISCTMRVICSLKIVQVVPIGTCGRNTTCLGFLDSFLLKTVR